MQIISWLSHRANSIALISTVFSFLSVFGAESIDTVASEQLNALEVVGNAPRRQVVGSVPEYILNSEAMQTMGVTDISDALHKLPGVNLRDYGGAGGLKTVSVRGLGAAHTAVILDGLPVEDNQNGFVDMSRFSPDNMQSLSLELGDGANIFTTAREAASPARINITTDYFPTDDSAPLFLRTRLRSGSWGMVNPYIKVGAYLGNNWSSCASADYRYADNNYPFKLTEGSTITEGKRNNSRMNSFKSDATVRHTSSDNSQLEAKAYYYHNKRQLPGSVTLYNPESNERLTESDVFCQIRWSAAPLGAFQWKAAAKFDWNSSRYQDSHPRYPGGELNNRYIQRLAYATASGLYNIDSCWSLSLASDYSYSNLSSNRKQPQPWRHSILTMAAARYRTETLLASVRLLLSDYHNGAKSGEASQDYTRLSPSASISIRPWLNQLFFLRTSYKEIFRMPTFADAYFGTTGSPTLRPETTRQANLGVTWQAPYSYRFPLAVFTADVYYNTIKDRIVALPQNMFVWSMINVGRVRSIGLDITANTQITLSNKQLLILAANYSYQSVKSRVTGSQDYDKQIAYTPLHSGSASIAFENPWCNVVFSMSASSERYGTNSNLDVSRIDGYTDCSLGLYRTFALKNAQLNLRADISNIFNTQYQIIARYPMPGRAWTVGITLDI